VAGPGFPALTITIDDIRQWLADRARLDAEIADRQTQRNKITTRIEAVAELVDDKTREAIFEAAGVEAAPADENSFVATIRRLIDEEREGVNLKDLREAIAATPLRERLERSPNTFYNGVKRLEARNEVVKRGKLLFTPQNLRLIIATHGEDWEGFDADGEIAPNDVVLKFAEKCGGSALPQQFIAELSRFPTIAEKIKRNPQYAYNVLSRLVRKDKLVREGKRYALPRKENEPPSGSSPQGDSDADSQDGLHPLRELFPKPRAVGA
jgi:hypothetical protein